VISRVLEARQRALVLVPEIALTPQTAGRFLARFGSVADEGRVAVLHSGMPASERHRQWALAASGRARVVVGARSAVFAPLADLGLIVVDEEHAGDYKQDQAPRYSARDVAIKRAQLEGCPVILGSATPSLESWANAVARPRTGREGGNGGNGGAGDRTHFLWELSERVGGGVLPDVEVVDLAAERRTMAHAAARDGGNPREIRAVGPTLETALRETIEANGQAILLLNRRGYSSYICCSDGRCGWTAQCDQCDAAMVLHRWKETKRRRDGETEGKEESGARRELVRCHHCLSEQMVPRICAVCQRKTILLGIGTQRLEEELSRRMGDLLPPDRMVRVDGDSMRSAADYFRVLSRFGAGEVRVLLGTQMIAKGLDFPNVQLVGVINADTGLSMPDFRAAERTFQLVSQVAGRAGRAGSGGRVIVQTINPQEPAIVLAARHDYLAFARREWMVRKRAGLPPITRMARVVVKDESPSKAEGRAGEIAGALRAAAQGLGVRAMIVGPAPCAISRIANEYRFSVEVTAQTAREVHVLLVEAKRAGVLGAAQGASVDVDPVALM
jgi:primosomal protein N' (replication factor Y) (superfamily II helicase)